MFQIDLITTYLWLGLFPVIYATIGASKSGLAGFANLRWVGVMFIWIGYHFSMWCAFYYQFKWTSFLLVPGFAEEGLLFSILWMWCYLLGYDFYTHMQMKKKGFPEYSDLGFSIPQTNTSMLAIMVIATLVFFTVNVGGLSEVWIASYQRGAGQFDARDIGGKILHMMRVVSKQFYVIVACYAAFYIYDIRSDIPRKLFGSFALLAASLNAIHSFSRASGFLLVIFAFLSVRLKGKNGLVAALFCCFAALYLGKIGVEYRGDFPPGVGSFIQAAVHTPEKPSGNSGELAVPDPESNPIDALAPWTRKAEARQYEYPGLWESFRTIVWNMNPFPSEIVPVRPLGSDLREIMRLPNVGITTPALAELFFGLSFWGSGFGVLIGICMAFFEFQAMENKSVMSSFCVLLCFISIPIGLHSSLRAMTRPMLYAFLLLLIVRFYERRNSSNKAVESLSTS